MRIKRPPILPKSKKILEELGTNLRLARLRRRLTAAQVAERAHLSRMTIYSVEKGSAKVAVGAYIQVLFVLGLEQDLAAVARDDVLGRKLQDAGLLTGRRAPRRERGDAD
ncbi:MAG: transcriptional regulator [Elusimicrobia bacterium CG1_02_63_36]|nr:MAG: transcriptional regulator [Elusimicrobia bacterium CG1_02_63_36]PIP82534.1 MAG: transcriptional regulator [Elusimicrobia bacterium CG22_combo_CG10-13_8_21_14_all_63_91]PJA14500.1 MAG: transcriptional regulator [Elusimicrobia bacterium CG_4_10_14_0_2_um_filter_63_34]PJB26357.1 MAG: transcriptional regulator [Elusimicrobia bacterium CG_4_9_14_3_um_filter_62_55]